MQNTWKKDYLRYKEFFLNILRVYYTKPNLKIYLELTLTLTTIVIFAVFAIKPTILTIIELNKEIKEKEQIITKLDTKLDNLQTADSILQQESARLTLVNESIPSYASPESLILEMENLVNKNSLKILNLSTSEVSIIDSQEVDDNEKYLLFTISITGQYQNILSLISDIENNRRPIKMDSLVINSNQTEEGKSLVLMISGKLPYKK